MFKKEVKIYITGASGLVGKNICENNDISQCTLLTPQHKELDLINYNDVFEFIKENKPDYIIHTAGLVGGIQANIDNPYSFLMENLTMGINLVRASYENNIKNFVNLSSSCAYPANINRALEEKDILTGAFEPTNEGYAIAKTAVLRACEYVSAKNKEFNYKTLIPCNLYGKYDNFSLQTSHLIPAIINKVYNAKLNNAKSIEIWGDGNSRREFMYATDFAQMVAQVIKIFDNIPKVLNIGLGFDYTINEYYEIISKIIGYNGEFTHDLSKPNGIKQKLLNISNQKNLNIISKYTLENGIKETYNFFIKNEVKNEI